MRSLLCVLAAIGIVLTGPAVAHATPSSCSVEPQIDGKWNALEPVIEQYNDVHSKLIKNQGQQKKLAGQIAPLQKQVDAALSQVRGVAANVYKQGAPNVFNALVISGTPTGLTDKLTLLDQLARHQRDQISNVAVLLDQFSNTKSTLDALTSSIAARDADLVQKKTAIQVQIDQLQTLRTKSCGAAAEDAGPYRTGLCPVTYTNDRGGRAAQRACALIGKPYVFGAEGPSSYDCSGLTKEAWGSVGVTLDHYTVAQWGETTPVSRDQLRPGDLVFYFPGSLHHMAMYIGGGMVVHAPHTGDHVRMATIDRGPIAGYRRPG